ncbi:MAG: amino acid adenylation domain-containing protein [Acidobacteriaceae bacterium]|nr:amino acid adenylation domain-containing protein [Acidobacteriaceae bacterium]
MKKHIAARRSETVQDVFERRVRLQPDAPAVYGADGDCWSYSRLNVFANRIAHRLLKRGVQPEWRVGVCMQRSPETIGVLLGILKARAAYIPLDLNLPGERLRYIAEDAMVREIFVDREGAAKLRNAAVDKIQALFPTTEEDLPDQSPELPSSKHDLANILYTSGSTGKPKGAMLEHCGILRLVVNTRWLTFSDDDIFLQISALSFDLSTFEIWGPLLNGGCVVTAPQSPSLGEIERLLEQFKVTTLWLTAGLFNVLMEERPAAIRNVKHLLTGGDIASPRHARIALEHLKRGELVNCYGPTENATFSTCHRVKRSDTEQPSIPIGSPVDKSPVFLLDESMKPIHDFRVGEIFVGGEGLSRGYWNRPELNTAKFVHVEVEPDTVLRLYRTGDLGRYNRAGLLEFVGRTDFQLKIRGFRVEPEEIELALSSMPGLASAAVFGKGTSPESKQLCCCYVQDGTANITTNGIRSFLKTKFPDYMVPTVFRELASLPRNTNDKVDRKVLDGLFANTKTSDDLKEPADRVGSGVLKKWALAGIRVVSDNDRTTSWPEKLFRHTASAFLFTFGRRPRA